MHFDDRLATVLRQRAGGAVTARIQYRQLLDLLGTLPIETQGPQIDAACDRLGELAKSIDPADRAAMLRDPGLRLRNPLLVALLASAEPVVAAAAISQARLSEDEWVDLAPALPVAARGLVRERRDLGPRAEALFERLGMVLRGLPPGESDAALAQTALVQAALAQASAQREPRHLPATPGGGFGAIVRRIEDFRKSRQPVEMPIGANDSRRAVASSHRSAPRLRAFDFATDPDGRIVWSDPGMAPMAVGLRLTGADATAAVIAPEALTEAMRHRQPIRAAIIEIAGAPAISGTWQVDGIPCFDLQTGRFIGFTGRLRRVERTQAEPIPLAAAESESDRMRQLLHELRTPVSAIQGFAEVIQQQLFGPTPHEYRALAASIAADAARMLAGFEELERLARLQSGKQELETGDCDFAEVLAATVDQLGHFTGARGSGFALVIESDGPLAVALSREEADRLAWRLLATLAGAARPGEFLKLRVMRRGEMAVLAMQLPASLALPEPDRLSAADGSSAHALSAGVFGSGFSLRLAAAEAAAAGGKLQRHGETLELHLPDLTAAKAAHSTVEGTSGAAR